MSDIPTTVKNKALVEKRREQIVLAAIKLFSQKGFHQTTLRELSEEAGISYGNIYDYVGSKNDIFYLIHEYLCDKAFDELERAVGAASDPMERLRRMVRAEFSIMDKWSDGILLLYQETHILQPPYLHKVLQKEHEHVQMLERVVRECVETGLLRPCQPRLVANFIKVMVDGWVLKRWDLRGHVSAAEVERAILDLLQHGLSSPALPRNAATAEDGALVGRKALVCGAETVLGRAVAAHLAGQGAQVCAHMTGGHQDWAGTHGVGPDLPSQVACFHQDEHGGLDSKLLARLAADCGPLDILVLELGLGSLTEPADPAQAQERADRLEARLARAARLAPALARELCRLPWGRVIFLAPWAWDAYGLPITHRAVVAGAQALAQGLALELAGSRTTVNCVAPGFIKTPRPSELQKAKAEDAARRVPGGQLGELSDVTGVVQFLASDDSRHLTGQTLRVSGVFSDSLSPKG